MEDRRELFCAYCLSALAEPKTCSACKRRVYCSRECQKADWSFGASGGQGHKHWCALRCGEEAREWAVRHISPERGRGVVMLSDVAAGARILVDAALHYGHPCLAAGGGARRAAALDLVPEGSNDLLSKFELNEYGSRDGPVIGLRLSRINSSCDPNAIKVQDDDFGVNVVVALRDIRAGEEVLLSYLPVDDCSVERSADESRSLLAAKWGVQCPADCRCHNAALAGLMARARELDARIFQLGGRCDVAGAVGAAKDLLSIYDEAGLRPLHMSRARTLFDAFQVCVMQKSRKDEAVRFLRGALEIHERIYHPNSSQVVQYKEFAASPERHKNYGVAK